SGSSRGIRYGSSGVGNPFVEGQSLSSASDLAGLTPEIMSSALQGALGIEAMKVKREELGQKKVSDVMDSLYKAFTIQNTIASGKRADTEEARKAAAEPSIKANREALTKESETRTKASEALDKPHPFTVSKPDGSLMTVREFNTLTPDQKTRLELLNARKQGTEDAMLKDMESLASAQAVPPTSLKEFNAAKNVGGYTGSYEEWVKDPSDWYEFKKVKAGGYAGTYPQWKEHLATISKAEKTPAPMTWTTATNELTKRYGKLDPTGMWAVTPELQATHRKAQSILNELREGNVHPLKAINDAENMANSWKNQIESKYFEFIDKAGSDKEAVLKIKSAFYNKYGYLPTVRR
ncbi:MAG: hypothetical protein KJ556_20505, partial [Gammaproteobacteria bacterium]|nr:hypothetical protein [Gammaproteobacteria bacterium]